MQLKFNSKNYHVVDITKVVNLIRVRALSHRQCTVALLEEHETVQADLGYHTPVRWLSMGKMLKRMWYLK